MADQVGAVPSLRASSVRPATVVAAAVLASLAWGSAPGSTQEFASIAVIPAARGTLSGQLQTTAGDSVANAEVSLWYVRRWANSTDYRLAASERTSHVGRFRFAELAAATYVLRATAPLGLLQSIGVASTDDVSATLKSLKEGQRVFGRASLGLDDGASIPVASVAIENPLAVVFYPSGWTPDSGEPLEVRPATDTILTFLLPPARSITIEGTVSGFEGSASRAVVTLTPSAVTAAGIRPLPVATVTVGPTGRFRFLNVPAGRYVAAAQIDPGGTPRDRVSPDWVGASRDVESLTEVSGLALEMGRGCEVVGRLLPDRRRSTAFIADGVTVSLRPAGLVDSTSQWTPPSAPVDSQGSFGIVSLKPGQYRLTLTNQRTRVEAVQRVAGVYVNDTHMPDGRVTCRPPDQLSVTLTYLEGNSTVRGRLFGLQASQTASLRVLIFPADRRLWTAESLQIRSVRPDTSGEYSFQDLPEAAYMLAVTTESERGRPIDAEYLAAAMRVALPLTVTGRDQVLAPLTVRRR